MNKNSKQEKRKLIELTPEWIFDEVPHTHYADGDGNISVYTNDTLHASLIELALKTLQISFQLSEYFDDNDDVNIGFLFEIEEIVEGCPTYYQKMEKLNKNNKNHKNQLKNYGYGIN